MSQRLLISKKENIIKEDEVYDCIYTEESTDKNLLKEWCAYDSETGLYFGPFKIRIRDYDLMDKFLEDFKKLGSIIAGLKSFDEVWAIYDETGCIHESSKENEKYSKIINHVIDRLSPR